MRIVCFAPAVWRESEPIFELTPASELHVFRGLETTTPGFIMGHEFVGIVVEAGSAVKTVRVGDKVVSPFTTSW